MADQHAPSLEAVQSLYDQGLYMQAYRLAEQRGPLASWKGTAERILAGRLAMNLGGGKLAALHHIKAWRQDRHHVDAVYYYTRVAWSRLGPLGAWRFLETHAPREGTTIQRADFEGLRASVAGSMRDFDRADACMAEALKLAPEHAWLYVEQSALMEMQDKYDAAMAAAEQALALRPWYRPAVQARAHLLVLAQRDDEALAFLREASQRLESNLVVWQLAQLQHELGLAAEMHESVERVAELTPLKEEDHEKWLLSQRCDAAYGAGNFTLAADLAGQIDTPYYKQLKQNMDAAGPGAKRVILDVPFVRQHRVTCAPATLSAISRLWKMPADHLSVAEEICYDGTTYASERGWAERTGWAVREFTLSWDAAVALIDRGCAFTLTTTELTSGHLQAVIGYDSRKKVLLIRDPFLREVRDFLADQTIDRYKPFGPRAMVMVPVAEAHRLEGIVLPDAPLWDQHYRATVALQGHQRAEAAKIQAEMALAAPDHRLTIDSRLSLAAYDGDVTTEVEQLNRLIALFPECRLWKVAKANRLRRLERQNEYRALVRELAEEKDADPTLLLMHASTLRADARQWKNALRLVARAIRRSPQDPQAYHLQGGILWDLRRFEEALEVYRVAACLGDKIESMSESYFIASRYLRQTDQSVKFLRDRYARFGRKSPDPGRTLYWALNELGRSTEALAVLDDTLKQHNSDGMLMLFASEEYARRGDLKRSSELVKQARGRCRHNSWLRCAAVISYFGGKLEQSLGYWQQLAELEPLSMDAHRAVTYRLEEVKGRAAALAHLDAVIERFPHQLSLREFLAQWLRRDDLPRCEANLRTLLQLHPDNAWAHRELASVLSDQNRHDEALTVMATARDLEPQSPSYFNTMAEIYAGAGRRSEARDMLRRSIELEVDNEYAIRRLIELTDGLPQRRAELRFIAKRLRESVTFGEGILAFYEQAVAHLELDELNAIFTEAHRDRPDLWHAWSALARLQTEKGDRDAAVALLKEATERFPLHARLWLDLAEAYRLQLDREREIDALRHAVNVRPDWLVPLRKLAEAHDREGELKEARKLLERAVTRDPTDPGNHGLLADVLWKLGERAAAFAAIEKAVSLAPNYGWAWGQLDQWSRSEGDIARAANLARQISKQRPGDPDAWIALADALYEGPHFAERLDALDRAIALSPTLITAHDRRAVLLCDARRFDEARKACRPPAFNEHPPVQLRGRLAWIEAERGGFEKAIKLMREVLREDDSYYWGWSKLCDWCREKKDVDGLVVAASNLVRLAPNIPQALGNLADAKLQADDRAGAKAALVRAFALDPDYDYAGHKLFELQIEDQEYRDAAATLERQKPHMPLADYLASRVMLASRSDQRAAAIEHLRQLARVPAVRACVDFAASEMQRAGWLSDVNQTLLAALSDPQVSKGAVASVMTAHAVDGEHEKCDQILSKVRPVEANWVAAMEAYLDVIGRNKNAYQVRRLIKRDREAIRARSELWGLAGYGLLQIDRLRDCVAWMSDWQQRPDAKPWMLVNLADALRCLGRNDEARAVNEYSITLEPDHGTVHHELWLGFEAAMAGDSQRGAQVLAAVAPESLDRYLGLLHRLLEVVVGAYDPPARGSRAAVRRSVTGLIAENPWIRKDAAMRFAFRSTARFLAKRHGGLLARLWQFSTWWSLTFGATA